MFTDSFERFWKMTHGSILSLWQGSTIFSFLFALLGKWFDILPDSKKKTLAVTRQLSLDWYDCKIIYTCPIRQLLFSKPLARQWFWLARVGAPVRSIQPLTIWAFQPLDGGPPKQSTSLCQGGGASQKHSTINHLSYPALRWWPSQIVNQSLPGWGHQSEAFNH